MTDAEGRDAPAPDLAEADPASRQESDQLPEEQPRPAAPGETDPERRREDAGGAGAGHGPQDRRATGNPHEDDRPADAAEPSAAEGTRAAGGASGAG